MEISTIIAIAAFVVSTASMIWVGGFRFSTLVHEVKTLKSDVAVINSKIERLELKIDANADKADSKIDKLETKIETRINVLEYRIEKRFREMDEKCESRFQSMGIAFERLENKMENLQTDFHKTDIRLTKIEQQKS